MMRNRNAADLCFSAVIVLFGLYIVYGGMQLDVGSFSRIGPGFFPVGLGGIITVLGLGVPFELQRPGTEERFNVRGLAFVSLALLAFAVLVESVGLFPAIAALVLLTMAGSRDRLSPLGAIATIGGLCAAGYLLFIVALNLPFDPFAQNLLSAR